MSRTAFPGTRPAGGALSRDDEDAKDAKLLRKELRLLGWTTGVPRSQTVALLHTKADYKAAP
jgi:hypothetical protein